MAARLTAYLVVVIVAATLVAGLMVGAQRDDNAGPVDLIVHHAHVYVADDRGTIAEAVAIGGNKVLRVGSEREIMRHQRPQTTVIDAHGGAVLPGFNDTHVSFIDAALERHDADLHDATDAADVIDRLTAWIDEHPDAAVIVGRGWPAQTPGVLPTRARLDALDKTRPVVLLSDDGRVAAVNVRAARALGLRAHPGIRPDVVDATVAAKLLPPASMEARAAALDEAIRDAQAHGITSIQDFSRADSDLELYADARRRGALGVRVYASVVVSRPDAVALDALRQRFPDDPLLKTGLAHVEDADPARLKRVAAAVDARGWQLALDGRTPDDAHTALEVLESVEATNPEPTAARRHRVEGLDALDESDLTGFRKVQAIAGMMPFPHAPQTSDAGLLNWPVKALRAARVPVVFGSGPAAANENPLADIAQLTDASGPSPLPLEAALNGWTADAAWASFDEHRKGTLRPGMLADLVVLSTNVFSRTPESLPAARVDLTVFDGKIVYRALR